VNRIREDVARHSYVMTIAYIIATAASCLLGILSFMLGATPVGAFFGVMFAICLWELTGWQATTGHGRLGRPFVSEAAEALHAPTWIIGAVLVTYFVTLVIVGPALAAVGFLT